MGSEAVLLYDLSLQSTTPIFLVIVATIGNSLGSVVNYILGYKGEQYLESKQILKKEKISKYKILFEKYGAIVLLFAWLPIVGDPFTFIAGSLRYNFFKFLILVTISKASRYIFIAYLSIL